MNRFGHSDFKSKIKSGFPLALGSFLLILLLFFYGLSSVSKSSVMNDRKLLSDALQRDIAHCYAVEGSYPVSIQYMQEHYGLLYDTDKYLINYEYIGSNIMPTYQIFER